MAPTACARAVTIQGFNGAKQYIMFCSWLEGSLSATGTHLRLAWVDSSHKPSYPLFKHPAWNYWLADAVGDSHRRDVDVRLLAMLGLGVPYGPRRPNRFGKQAPELFVCDAFLQIIGKQCRDQQAKQQLQNGQNPIGGGSCLRIQEYN